MPQPEQPFTASTVNDVDTEKAVIAALIMDAACYCDIKPIVKAEDFSLQEHRILFATCMQLAESNKAIDELAILAALKEQGSDHFTISYLVGFSNVPCTVHHVKQYAQTVASNAAKRRTLVFLKQKITDILQGKAANIHQFNCELQSSIAHLTPSGESTGTVLKGILGDVIDVLSSEKAQAIPSGFMALDEKIGGLCENALIIAGAQTGRGKSIFGMQLALNAAKHNSEKQAVVFSLEMSKIEYGFRIMSSETEINLHRLLRQKKELTTNEWDSIMATASRLHHVQLRIVDEPMDIERLISLSHQMHRERPLSVVVVDYLQMLSASGHQSRELEVSYISRALKELAKNLSITVVGLAQLNRDAVKRGNKKPQLSDLRESASIALNADVVLFIHYPYDDDEAADRDLVQLLLRKNRNGDSFADIDLNWRKEIVRFDDKGAKYEFPRSNEN